MREHKSLEIDFTPEKFEKLREFIENRSGVYVDEARLDALRISLVTEMSINQVDTFDEYYDLLSNRDPNQEAFRNLLNLITLNESSFFKTNEHFQILAENLLPEIVERKEAKDKTLRVWSAGCSTGEEPYSIAIVLLESIVVAEGWKIEILATDVSQNALAIAEAGEYFKGSLKDVRKEWVDKYLEAAGDKYRVKDSLKKLVKFKYLNLIREPFPIEEVYGQDIIFCRNVTIHFKIESTRRVISRFYDTLPDVGYLFIGPHETLLGITNELRHLEINKVSLYCKGPSALFSRVPSKLVIATIYLNQKKYEFAKSICTDLMTREPAEAEHHLLLGMIFKQEGKVADGIQELEQAIGFNPQLVFAYYQLAEAYEATGHRAEAQKHYTRAIEIARTRPAFTPIEVVNRISRDDIIVLSQKGQERVAG